MRGIAATLAEGRRDFFWLNRDFGMMASSPVRGGGFNLSFGGIFTSVPAAVASTVKVEPIIGGAGLAASGAATGGSDPGLVPVHHDVGGPLGGITPTTHQLDVFGLGLDYAMWHKRIRGTFDQNDPSPWHRLDGVFVSAPAAVAWGSGIHVFGLGTDHAMYTKSATGDTWTPDWQRLGGTFTSAASLVSRAPHQLDLFARGADFTLRRNQTEGTTWFGWQNHGGSLASPPVAVSWGADRIDVFAVFKDGALWHLWWDGQIWNQWESLGGNYTGEPAAVSSSPGQLDVFAVGAQGRGLHHHRFSNNTWSLPQALGIGTQDALAESPTVISGAPNQMEIFVPTVGNQIRIGKWDGQSWQFGSAGAEIRMPSRYRMSVDQVKVNTTRAMNADTDAAMASVGTGNAAVATRTQWIGELGALGSPKTAQTNLLDFEPVTVELAEPMTFSYVVVNNGHADQDKVLAALTNAGHSIGLAGSSSMQEDIAKGIANIVSVTIAGALTISVPVVGSVVGAIESWLMGQLTDAIFESCDGVVAVELRAMLGRDLFMLTDNGKKPLIVTTKHPGTASPSSCGANSEYEVTWSIEPL